MRAGAPGQSMAPVDLRLSLRERVPCREAPSGVHARWLVELVALFVEEMARNLKGETLAGWWLDDQIDFLDGANPLDEIAEGRYERMIGYALNVNVSDGGSRSHAPEAVASWEGAPPVRVASARASSGNEAPRLRLPLLCQVRVAVCGVQRAHGMRTGAAPAMSLSGRREGGRGGVGCGVGVGNVGVWVV